MNKLASKTAEKCHTNPKIVSYYRRIIECQMHNHRNLVYEKMEAMYLSIFQAIMDHNDPPSSKIYL